MKHVDLKYFKACFSDGYSIYNGETTESDLTEIFSTKNLSEDRYDELILTAFQPLFELYSVPLNRHVYEKPTADPRIADDRLGIKKEDQSETDEPVTEDQYTKCDICPLTYEAVEFVREQKRIACEMLKEEGIVDDLGRRIYTTEEKKSLHYGKVDREIEEERILRWVKNECRPTQVGSAIRKLYNRFSASQRKCIAKRDFSEVWLRRDQYHRIKDALIMKGKERETVRVVRKEKIGKKRYIVKMIEIEIEK